MAHDWDRDWGREYDDVYDNTGDSVSTDCCHVPMKFDGHGYICPKCKRRISRREFFGNYVQPYGSACYSCKTNFPRCVICHKDLYQEECDRFTDYYD